MGGDRGRSSCIQRPAGLADHRTGWAARPPQLGAVRAAGMPTTAGSCRKQSAPPAPAAAARVRRIPGATRRSVHPSIITKSLLHDYYQLLRCYYINTTALLMQYYLITTYEYLLLCIITKPLLHDYYPLLRCYYINTTTLLMQYYLITTYEYPLLCIITKPLLFYYCPLLHCYYTIMS